MSFRTSLEQAKVELGRARRLVDRRQHHRHDMEPQSLVVEKWDGRRREGAAFGQLVDMSSGGARIRTTQGAVRPEQQICVRLRLPAYAGISPFIDGSKGNLEPRNEWVGWMAVKRVRPVRDGYEVAGELLDMDDLDRGMLGLYLSTQPLAA